MVKCLCDYISEGQAAPGCEVYCFHNNLGMQEEVLNEWIKYAVKIYILRTNGPDIVFKKTSM